MNAADLDCRETPAGLEIRLHVQPRAKHCEMSGIHNRALKIKVTAPPVDDAANRAVVELFSALLGISRSSLQIISGLKSRDKTLQIKGISLRGFLDRIH
jgi:uncharacterized protein